MGHPCSTRRNGGHYRAAITPT
ncbi:hypothetical protein YPPY15_2857, partial [Yersinia pestis PY-15]